MSDDRPISRLSERVDDLLRALGRMPNLPDMVAAMRAHEELVDRLGPEVPGVVDALAGSEFRRALIDVMDEVLVVKRKGAGLDHTN